MDFFGRLHSIDNIKKDIAAGSRTDNHVTRVYVLPEQEGKGFGSVIMDRLEDEIMRKEKGLKVSGGQNE